MFEFLVGDFAIVVGATLVCVCAWRIFPFAVRRIIHDEPTRRSYINRAFLAAGGAAIIWIAVFDNWRQVLGIPTGWIQDEKSRIASDPFYSGDVADPVRAVSWILFLTAVAGGAYFFARFSRGWLEPLTLGPVAAVLFYVLNTFRLRFDVDSVRIAYGTIESPLDVALTLMWIALLMVTMGLLVLGMYLVAWSPATLVFSVIYRRFINPQDREEPPIFRKLREERTMTEMHGG